MSPKRDRVSCGLDIGTVADLPTAINDATEAGYQFVFTPLVHPRWRRELLSGALMSREEPLTRSDLVLSSQDWTTLVVGRLSAHVDVDCGSSSRRRHAELLLREELAFASHLSLPAVVLSLSSGSLANLARHLCSTLAAGSCFQVWVEVPLTSPAAVQSQYLTTPAEDKQQQEEGEGGDAPWRWWHALRRLCGEPARLGVCLALSADLPPEHVLQRWLGEPVKCVRLATSLFVTNKSGFPVLPRGHQQLLRRLLRLGCQLVVAGQCWHAHTRHYWQYLNHVHQTACAEPGADPGAIGPFSVGYEDYLQMPLQPLMDNLESHTYEVFEKCPVKYTEYQKAMYSFFKDRVSDDQKTEHVIVVMVVGAGRGPLVRCAFQAAAEAERKIRVYAVEKNPNAVVTLRAAVREEWGDSVTVVSCDMRSWCAPEQADLLVSELLGSFGDNELSPECLDGAQRYLKDDGVSIPQSYTSFIQPLQSPKLYNDVRSSRERDKPHYTPFEMPYVVFLQNIFRVDKPQSLFTFCHPNRDAVIDNSRFGVRAFRASCDCCVHGVGGYFEAVLYKDITISTHPDSHSTTMCSWFPIFFPLQEPVTVRAGEEVRLAFWRVLNARSVWYEWTVLSPQLLPVHNSTGRSYTIGL